MHTVADNKGMSLIELAIVLAIAGILATIAIPNYLAMLPKIRANMAVADVSGRVMKAKLKSVSENMAYFVVFNTAANTCKIYRDKDFDADYQATDTLVETLDIDAKYPGIVLGHNVATDTKGAMLLGTTKVSFSDGVNPPVLYEVFRPNGTAKYSGSVYIIPVDDLATGRSDRCRAVTVEAMTGFVKTWSYDENLPQKWH